MINCFVGNAITSLRVKKQMMRAALEQKLIVNNKTIFKYETAKGLTDITLIEHLVKVFCVSVAKLMRGDMVINKNMFLL